MVISTNVVFIQQIYCKCLYLPCFLSINVLHRKDVDNVANGDYVLQKVTAVHLVISTITFTAVPYCP